MFIASAPALVKAAHKHVDEIDPCALDSDLIKVTG